MYTNLNALQLIFIFSSFSQIYFIDLSELSRLTHVSNFSRSQAKRKNFMQRREDLLFLVEIGTDSASFSGLNDDIVCLIDLQKFT